MRPFETLIYEKEGAIARVSLDRPAVLNAYNIQMRDDFSEALRAVSDDPDVRALLITGEGRAFCAGADLTEFGTAPSLVIARQVRWQRDVWGQMIDLDIPAVAAVHGYCIGSGLEIALLCDIRLAAEDTVFAMPEVRLGMIPAAGGTQTLPRHAGASQALDLLLTGRRFTAREALDMGPGHPAVAAGAADRRRLAGRGGHSPRRTGRSRRNEARPARRPGHAPGSCAGTGKADSRAADKLIKRARA